jgi:hypothetical protein
VLLFFLVLGRAAEKVLREVALTMSCSMGSFLLQSHPCCLGWPLLYVSGHLRLDVLAMFLSKKILISIPNIFNNIVQVKKHTSYMMTIEMSFIGSICLLASTYQSSDGEAIRKYGFFHEWTLWTLVSISLLFCYAMFPHSLIELGLLDTCSGVCSKTIKIHQLIVAVKIYFQKIN